MIVLFVTADRRKLIERTAREIAVYGYEPRTRLDRARTAIRREITGDAIRTPRTRDVEDQLEALILAEVQRLSALVTMPRRPGGDVA